MLTVLDEMMDDTGLRCCVNEALKCCCCGEVLLLLVMVLCSLFMDRRS